MLSIPHMIVVFVVVLVVFGPQKLPELARGLGKLMAEFRKASTDFKTAFEEEMRDIERQARETERKKLTQSAPEIPSETSSDSPTIGAPPAEPVIAPVAESVPRSSEDTPETKSEDLSAAAPADTTHDHQQPA
ncbi:MAG: twin-arginine translocase TatA/TatE family subunit [Candidatus Acidiferrales bacterium]